MRHALVLAAALALLAAANAMQGLAAAPGVAWVPVARPRQLHALLAQGDVRLLDLRAGGHLAQLHVGSPRAWRGPALWLPAGFALPACG